MQASEGHALARELQSAAEEALEGSVRYTEANPATGEGVSATMALLTKQALLARELDHARLLGSTAHAAPERQSCASKAAAALSSVKRRVLSVAS